MRNDATKLSEDLGKLAGGAAPCKLLVTLIPQTQDDGAAWLDLHRREPPQDAARTALRGDRAELRGQERHKHGVDSTPEMRTSSNGRRASKPSNCLIPSSRKRL